MTLYKNLILPRCRKTVQERGQKVTQGIEPIGPEFCRGGSSSKQTQVARHRDWFGDRQYLYPYYCLVS
jgi:hypothetical protein